MIFWFLLFLVLGIICYSLYQLFRKPIPDYFSNSLSAKFWDDVDTGDLIFFSGTSFGERSVKFYSSSVWTHVGIVFRDLPKSDSESKIYFAEADVGQRKRDGPRVILLSEKIQAFKKRVGSGSIVGWRKFSKGEISPLSIMCFVEGNLQKTMDANMIRWIFAWWPNFGIHAGSAKEVFCTEFVADLLITQGILGSEKIPAWYSPGKLSNIGLPGYEKIQIIRVPEFLATFENSRTSFELEKGQA